MYRNYSFLDRVIMEVEKAMHTVFARPMVSSRHNPAQSIIEQTDLSDSERYLSGRMMRVNHAGEISAQGLYQGQALTARKHSIQMQMKKSAEEENDHLLWCDQRIEELRSHKSYLGPLWYVGSYAIGAIAGLVGDRWSLGFVKETERQVVKHLEDHLERLPPSDLKSQAILKTMLTDEAHHAHVASSAGAAELPPSIKKLMTLVSKVMTRTAFWI